MAEKSIFKSPEDTIKFKHHEKWALIGTGKLHINTKTGIHDISIFLYPFEYFNRWVEFGERIIEKEIRSAIISSSNLSRIIIGNIYSYEGILQNRNLSVNKKRGALKIAKNFYIESLASPFNFTILQEYLPLFVTLKNSPCIIIEQETKYYIIPSTVIAQHFYFESSTLVSQIFNDEALLNAKLNSGPYIDSESNKLTVDITFEIAYSKKVQKTLAWLLCSEAARKTISFISNSFRKNINFARKGKIEKAKNSAYFECYFPRDQNLDIYFSYFDLQIPGGEYRLVNEIIQSVDKVFFERIIPRTKRKTLKNKIFEDNASHDTGNKPNASLDEIDLIIDEGDLEVENYPSIEPEITENYFNTSEVEFEKPIAIISENAESPIYENEIRNTNTIAGDLNTVRNDDTNNNFNSPFGDDDTLEQAIGDESFYKDFCEMLNVLKDHNWEIQFTRYDGDFFLSDDFGAISKEYKTKKYITIIARIRHPKSVGYFYLIENGIKDNPKKHYTSLLNYPTFNEFTSADLNNIITGIITKNGQWSAIKKSKLLDIINQRSFEHQEDKGNIHYARKINNYVKNNFCDLIPEIE